MAEIEPTAEAAAEPIVDRDRSVGGAVDRAFETAFAPKEEAPAAEAAEDTPTEEVADDRPRGPDGKFVAKQDDPAPDTDPAPAPIQAPVEATAVPGWLADPAAKAEWAKVPPQVQAQVSRRIGELESGLTQYRQQWEPLKQFAEQAKAQGTDIATAMGQYVSIENTLRQNPLQGLNTICQNMGLDLRQVAAHIMGQPHDSNAETAQLRHENARLRQVEQQFQSQQAQSQQRAEADAQERVTKFAAGHPRFDELSPVIGWALRSGLALDDKGQPNLDLAYEYAERLRPVPQAATPNPQPAQTRAATPAPAQTRKADISIDGAPGSNPVRPKSRSSGEAIDRAFDQLGL
jgi:phage terminase small subunit